MIKAQKHYSKQKVLKDLSLDPSTKIISKISILLNKNGKMRMLHIPSNLAFKAQNCSWTTFTNTFISNSPSYSPPPLMVKCCKKKMLEIKILTHTISCVYTQINVLVTHSIFGFFPLMISPHLSFTTQLHLKSSWIKNLWMILLNKKQ